MADNRKLAQGLMMMTPAMRADLAGREQDIQRGKTVELLRRAGKEMYENPIVNTAIGLSPGAGDIQAGYEAINSAQQGNYGEAGLNALGVLPFIPALGGITKNIKPETLEQLGKYFDESAIEAIKAPLDYKSRQTTVLMNPNEFLAYAAKDAPNKLKAAEIEQKFAEGSKLAEENIPQLWFDQQGNVASITGHEGRHRARYLQEQGVELMPVNVKSSNIRWSEQVEPNRFDYVQEWPQTLQNQDLTMNTPFPLTREGQYVSSMDKQQSMRDPFWREEAKLPKPGKAEIDALAAEFEDYYKNSNQPVAQALRDYRGAHTAPGPEFGAQLHDLTGGGQMYPDDVYSPNAYRFYGHGGPDVALDKETTKIAQSFRGKPDEMVDIYRAVPNEGNITSINAGDWITINPNYAKQHGESQLGGDYKILQQKVPAKTIWTNADSIHEYGYWPE